MRKLLLVLACFALLSVAAKPPGATLSIASDDGTDVVVAVSLENSLKHEAGSVWVMAVCYDAAGVPVTRQDAGDEGGLAGPFQRSADHCAAWAYVFGEGIVSDALSF